MIEVFIRTKSDYAISSLFTYYFRIYVANICEVVITDSNRNNS